MAGFSQTVRDVLRQKARTVAIDLESDGESVFQIGWKNAKGADYRENKAGLSRAELNSAVDDCLCGQNAPCIVGHNLLSWDWPILEQQGVEFPKTSERWDTLIASWILEPWLESHALVVKEHAHRADMDASACYALFQKQVRRFLPCLEGVNPDIRVLVERLYENPSRLSSISGRDYPASLCKEGSHEMMYPSSQIHEVTWRRECHIELVAPENRLADPVLSQGICGLVAQQMPNLPAKLTYIIVCDAAANHVEVRLSQLPEWLADDDLRSTLREAHAVVPTAEHDGAHTIYLAEDIFKLDSAEITARFADCRISLSYPKEIAVVWQKMRRQTLKEADVREAYPGVAENRSSRALIPVRESGGAASWLLYEPPGLTADHNAWSLLQPLPDWLDETSDSMQGHAGLAAIAQVPRWRDGDVRRLDLDRLFVSPDTANRPLYLAETAHCILNLLRAFDEDIFILVGVRWHEEAEFLQRNLIQLGLSTHHQGGPLRHLERVHQKGLRVLACDLADLRKYSQSAERLGIATSIVFCEVPLHDWYALSHEPEIAYEMPTDTGNADVAVDGIQDDESILDDFGDHVRIPNHVVLRGSNLRDVVLRYLPGWIQGIVGSRPASSPVLILDPRLADPHVARALQIQRRDVPFHAVEEILDADKQGIFYEVCFPRRDPALVPNEYEDYRQFLLENWGYEDFRPGTQRPAIEKLTKTDRDLLLRLPTGAGKSIVFHLPALLRSHYSGRLTVVITPLRALMRDQAEGLWRRHFMESVDYLSGGRDAWINYEVYQGVLDGRIRLLFVAPERFRVPRFAETLERRRRMDGGLEFVVFDEAHCISEWGFDFRPDYLFAAQYVADWFKKKDLPGNPHRLLLTSATVTQRNRLDLEKELALGPAGSYEDLPEDMPHPIQPFIELESFDLHEDEESPSDEKFQKIIEKLATLDLTESGALVFVRRRKDCHRLSTALNAYATKHLASLHALPFHAGLPETVKAEACNLLRERKANVLVCTKAFGMGMDIPHLHACIHHRPPTFIEDYLQEVGRVGRDENVRLQTGHKYVIATLLYNENDLERNLSLLHEKAIRPTDLQDFFAFCLEIAVPFAGVGKSLCIVPAKIRLNEKKNFDETQVTNCLFWLERMSVLKIEGRHPPFIDLTLYLQQLRLLTEGSTLPSQIAALLLGVAEESHKVVHGLAQPPGESEPAPEAEGIFGRVIKGLLRGVLALISPTKAVEQTRQTTVTSDLNHSALEGGAIDMSVSMSELMAGCGEITSDDLFLGLFELSKAGALSLRKRFVVLKNGAPSENEFWDLLGEAVQMLLRPTQGTVELIDRKQLEVSLQEWYRRLLSERMTEVDTDSEPSAISGHLTRRIQREVYRAISTALRILRFVGVQVRESIAEDGVAKYARSIPATIRSALIKACEDSIEKMQALRLCVSAHEPHTVQSRGGTFKVLLTDIMEKLGPEIRIGRLRDLMKLLESAGFYGFDGAIEDWVSLASLNTLEPLAPYDPEATKQSRVQEIYKEINEKHELQILRAQAMVLLAAMPTEHRKQYIDRYFKCTKAGEIEVLLEETVGDVDDQVIAGNPMLQELLSRVRREQFTEKVNQLNEHQLRVCKAPFDRTLLVNAGPGAGKTHVLTMRCAHLIHEQRVDPAEILVLAFNRAVVYEIRDRVRTLFRTLGYGSYANRLDVSTFHRFAIRHREAVELLDEDAIGQAVHQFAEEMQTNMAFARTVAGRFRAVLVDEFQDMNEDFDSVVRSLLANCAGGGLVIGDDDQDILTWNRRQWQAQHGEKCPLQAVDYFQAFCSDLSPEQHDLTLNYRSVPRVVERANGMIDNASAEIGFARMKSRGIAAIRQEEGAVETLDPANFSAIVSEAIGRGDSTAVLCRSNRECRQVYDNLVGAGNVTRRYVDLLGAEDFPLYKLRHCGALLDICHSRQDYEFVEAYIWEELLQEYDELNLADNQNSRDYLDRLYTLVRHEAGRPRIRDLMAFILEMRASDVDRLTAKAGPSGDSAKVTVATVHKVKGLEYDTVLVMPSQESFPFASRNGNVTQPDKVDSAEEARLFYVAMTRARNRLHFGWGDRERSWWSGNQYAANNNAFRYSLQGSPREMFVSWPGLEPQVQSGLQDYVGDHVCVGDLLSLQGDVLRHRERDVGRLSKKAWGNLQQNNGNPSLRVSNVIRYTSGPYFKQHQPELWDKLDNRVKRQGWFYLVLAEEA